MKNGVLILLVFLLNVIAVPAQVAINTTNDAADPSAMLDVKSAGKGLLVPRMTAAERDAIASPATGLLIFCTDNQQFYSNKGTPSAKNWVMVNSQWISTGADIYFNSGNVGIGTASPVATLHVAGNTFIDGNASVTGKLSTTASSPAGTGFVIPHGNAPETPVNGDLWTTTSGLYARINGTTVGPFGTGTGNGTVASVSATAPIISTGGATPDISIPQATWLTGGYLSSADWSAFYSKVGSVSANTPLTSTGGINPTINLPQASAINSGYLTSYDWILFNGKENGLTFNNPLARVGNIISLPAASVSLHGYLSSSDYTRMHGNTGSLLFFDAGGIQQKNASLFWDNTNNRLGILTNSPVSPLTIGASNQFQVTAAGSCSVSLNSTGPAITATNSYGSGTGIVAYGQGTSSFDQSTPSGGAFKGTTFGVYGESVYNASGGRFGGYFYTRKSDVESSYAYVGGYLNNIAKTIYGPGYLSMFVSSPNGGNVDMFGLVVPEILMNDYGTGILKDGFCHIVLDPEFSNNIISSPEHPIKVFIQMEGDCNGVFEPINPFRDLISLN